MTKRDDLDDLLDKLSEVIMESEMHEVEIAAVLGTLLAKCCLNHPLMTLSQMTSFTGSFSKTIIINNKKREKNANPQDPTEI